MKKRADQSWEDVLEECKNGIIDRNKITQVMTQCQEIDYRIIKEKRRELFE